MGDTSFSLGLGPKSIAVRGEGEGVFVASSYFVSWGTWVSSHHVCCKQISQKSFLKMICSNQHDFSYASGVLTQGPSLDGLV